MSEREGLWKFLRRNGNVLLGLLLVVGFFTALMVYGAHHWMPDCQTFLNNHFTGTQVIDGRHVQCFHGNVVRVGR